MSEQQSMEGLLNIGKKKPSINEEALAYMEQKYGEPFQYAEAWGNSMSGTHELLVSCASLPDELILVEVRNFRKENKEFRDNYIAVKYKQETTDFLQDCASSVFGEANVYYEEERAGLSADLPADASFADFMTDKNIPWVVLIEIRENNFTSEDQVEQLAKHISASGPLYYLTVVVTAQEEYGTFDRKELRTKISLGDFIRCAQVRSTGGDKQITWTERSNS